MSVKENHKKRGKWQWKLLPQTLLVAAFVTGCSSTIHKKAMIDGIDSLSIDAKQRLVVVNQYGGPNKDTRVLCAEPSPDALVAQAAALSANLKTPQSVGAALGAASNESAGSIGMRTQTIQILRDGYYRICEAYMNGSIDEDQYREVLLGIDEFIMVVAAINSLGGTVQAPAITLTTGAITTSAKEGEAKADTAESTVKVGELIQAEGTLSRYQSAAIAEIVANYLQYKKDLTVARIRAGGKV